METKKLFNQLRSKHNSNRFTLRTAPDRGAIISYFFEYIKQHQKRKYIQKIELVDQPPGYVNLRISFKSDVVIFEYIDVWSRNMLLRADYLYGEKETLAYSQIFDYFSARVVNQPKFAWIYSLAKDNYGDWCLFRHLPTGKLKTRIVDTKNLAIISQALKRWVKSHEKNYF